MQVPLITCCLLTRYDNLTLFRKQQTNKSILIQPKQGGHACKCYRHSDHSKNTANLLKKESDPHNYSTLSCLLIML